MNAIPFVIGSIALFVIAYRLYFSFVAAKVAGRTGGAVSLGVGVTTLTAGFLNMKNIYLPQIHDKATLVPGLINLILTLLIIICVFIILINAIPKWIRTIRR